MTVSKLSAPFSLRSSVARLACIGVAAVTLSYFIPTQVQAQTIDPLVQQREAIKDSRANGGQTLNSFSFDNQDATLASTYIHIMGDPELKGSDGQGAIPAITQQIAQLYRPPAKTSRWVADTMRDAGFFVATPAYAQGIGFASLDPVLDVWKMFRNIAYFFYVIIFLVIGFLIMLRQKVGAQAAINVQQALPNIVVSLLAVTFSYAIAGVMIDLMYLSMFFLLNIGRALPSFPQNITVYNNIFKLAGDIFGQITALDPGANDSIYDLAKSVTGNVPGISDIIAWIGSITAAVIFAFAFLFSMFRTFFELLKVYVFIILDIISAPLTLMMGALPGKNYFFTWVKGLFFKLAVFPAVLVVIIVAFALVGSEKTTGGFSPPFLLGPGTGSSIPKILGMGILLIIPDIVMKIKNQAGKGFFDEFAGNMKTAIERGWKGDQLIPGLGFTDTSKWGHFGSAKSVIGDLTIGRRLYGEKADQNKPFDVKSRGVWQPLLQLGRNEPRVQELNQNAAVPPRNTEPQRQDRPAATTTSAPTVNTRL